MTQNSCPWQRLLLYVTLRKKFTSASVKGCRLQIQNKPLCFSGRRRRRRRVKKRLVGLRFGLPPFVRPSVPPFGEKKRRRVRHSLRPRHDPRGREGGSLCGHASSAPSLHPRGGLRRRRAAAGREGGTVASPSVVGFDGPHLRLRLTCNVQNYDAEFELLFSKILLGFCT